ncbi:serine threonine-protein kinase [Stylosanthes scabra]|uniref:non-specific serine/threonine protein kinase n=1 Tax=Stylosanthes scabra TaxID=79078 RepID=A0ABU6TVW2_9FABA|nr:serine threonine-protein kinase [Stylosanthes scabra]
MDNGGNALDFGNLKVVSALGRGAKGLVFLAKTYEGQWLALKVVSKALIRMRNSSHRKRVSFEQQILRRFNHPLLPRLRGVLETEELLGFAIDFCHGGNLHSLRRKQSEKTFTVDAIRFYAVELVTALDYLHNIGVVYRDLKPENILIQESGHIMLVDFDLSKKLNPKSPQSVSAMSSPSSDSALLLDRRKRLLPGFCYCHSGVIPLDSDSQLGMNSPARSESDSVEKSNSFVGTEDYVSPEIITGEGHNFSADWWSLGVVLYEMLYGMTPFKGVNRKNTFQRILTKQPDLTGETTPLKDLIKKLLEKHPDRRIEVDEIKCHDFFKGVNWNSVLQIARPPYIPQNDIEDKAGFSRKDVESFVHKVFFKNDSHKEDKTKETEKKKINGANRNNIYDKNQNTVWVNKLTEKPTKNGDFLVF